MGKRDYDLPPDWTPETQRFLDALNESAKEKNRRLSRYDEALGLLRDYEAVFGCTEDAEFAMRVRKFLSEEAQ
jgi:hypothetical protein